ncbi:MAG: tetratricopeptide repeat protein [Proteobacteria bacterium]|nr:tetratricopeptide repeat protein [Pseudomonadota bacterium]
MRLRTLFYLTLPPLLLAAWAGHVFLGDKKQTPEQALLADYAQRIAIARAATATGNYQEFTKLGNLLRLAPAPLRNGPEALKWLRKAADKGYAAAQLGLGEMYEQGQGVKQDYHRAAEWYVLATRLSKDSVAYFRLGELYLKGHGVAQDYSKALANYQIAAAAGHPVAHYILGTMAESGWGMDRDLIAAYIHYAIAAAQAPAVTAYHQEFNTQAAKARVTAAMNRSQVDFAEKKLATMPK